MAEQFRVDSTFGYGAAVHGNVFGVFACRVSVYYLRKKLLAGAALAHHQHTEVNRGHLDSALHGTHQSRGRPYDAEAKFGLLYVFG